VILVARLTLPAEGAILLNTRAIRGVLNRIQQDLIGFLNYA
jgi:hypothetical protein